MKKFYSFIAFASMMLASVFGFTSCDKNNDDFNNQAPTPLQTTQAVTDDDVKDDDAKHATVGTVLKDHSASMTGTWEGTDTQGNKYTLEFTNTKQYNFHAIINSDDEHSYMSNTSYDLTVKSGNDVFKGKFMGGLYGGVSEAKNHIGICADKYFSEATADSFKADVTINFDTKYEGVVFTKVK